MLKINSLSHFFFFLPPPGQKSLPVTCWQETLGEYKQKGGTKTAKFNKCKNWSDDSRWFVVYYSPCSGKNNDQNNLET